MEDVSYAGGMLLYTVYRGIPYILLGKDEQGKWSDFGGKNENKDFGNPKLTAVRECYEETLGVIFGKSSLQYFIDNGSVLLKGKSYTNKDYFMYLTKIPYTRDCEEVYKRFYNHANKYNWDHKYREKVNITWHRLEEIENGNNMRTVFKNTYMQNKSIIENVIKACVI
mgnify:CR=1 FL=1|tara:strand:- start:5600 stop:6103 length:504 start_codon:yes stop_codon:yes gene_type:complete